MTKLLYSEFKKSNPNFPNHSYESDYRLVVKDGKHNGKIDYLEYEVSTSDFEALNRDPDDEYLPYGKDFDYNDPKQLICFNVTFSIRTYMASFVKHVNNKDLNYFAYKHFSYNYDEKNQEYYYTEKVNNIRWKNNHSYSVRVGPDYFNEMYKLIEELGLKEEYENYKEEYIKSKLIDWCKENNIEFIDS